MTYKKQPKSLRSEVLTLLDTWQPTTVADLIALLAEKRGISASETEISRTLKELRAEGRLELELPQQRHRSFSSFLSSLSNASDFWGIVFSLLILDTIVSIPSNDWLSPVRWILGALAIFLFPGYSIQMGLFPGKQDLLVWKRIVLAVGLSIAIVGFYAVILDATTQGIVLGSVLIVFSAHNLIFAWIGLVRRFEAETR
jgi:uncharacterized protein DUF1616